MHQEKDILSDKVSMDRIVAGIDKLANVVKKTLGPKGSNVIYTDQWGIPRITNDGVTIAKQIVSEDETEHMAIDALKQQAARTNMQAGDASTTFITLSQAIIHEGLKSEKHSLEKREEINSHCQIVLGELKKQAKPLKTFEEIKNVATVSVEDEKLGHLIAEANEKVGKEGKIDVQESETNGIRVEYTNGLEIDEGYIAEFMMNNERGEAVLENPYVMIVNSKLGNIKDILPVVQNLADNGVNELLLLCDGLEGNMIPSIAKNKHAKMQGANVMDIVAVKFPAIRKPEFIEDIALVTQGKVFGMSTGLFPDKAPVCKLRNPQTNLPQDPQYALDSKKFIEEHLGRCEKVVITSKRTTFIGGKGDVKEKIETLRNQRDASEINKDAFDDRIARLKGQVAVIKVGAASGVDLGYLKDKIEDAIYATKGAIQEGAVRGGGMALKLIALELPDGILKQALQAPYNQIQENAGGNFKIEDNVFDSVKSTRIVVENACSFAGSLLTTTSSIATKRVKPQN
jgi:chaperonin GroEL